MGARTTSWSFARLDLDADAAELPFGVALEGRELLGRHVARVRVELGDHPLDGAVDELRPVDRVDVLVLDLDEHPAELLDGGVRRVAARGSPPPARAVERGRARPAANAANRQKQERRRWPDAVRIAAA